MSGLRQRKMKPEASSSSSTPSDGKSGQSAPVYSKDTAHGRPTLSRLRVLLVAAPLILAWYTIIVRRTSTQQLPATYAVCSKHGQIYSLDSNGSKPECVVFDKGLIAAVGTVEEVRTEWGDVDTLGSVHKREGGSIKIYWLRGTQMMLPGLIDAHAHILQYGESVSSVDLVGSQSIDDVVKRIADFIEADPILRDDKSRFVLGLGWDQSKWEGGEFPTADDLDRDPRLQGRPIYLKRIDVHALWVSNSILSMIGELPPSYPTPGGLIVRKPNGEPSGIFVDNAQTLVLAVVPPWTDADRLKYLTTTARAMLDSGLTSVHDASLTLEDIRFLKQIDQEGRLPIRIYGLVSCEPLNSYCGDQVERYDGDRFTVRGVKLFTDGALGSWGAAMHEPYSDNPKETGILISDEAVFAPLIKKWMDKGFQVCSHAIGDRANTIILDAYEKALPKGVDPLELDIRPRIEHAQIMTTHDIARMGRLGVVASFQPTHATSDMGYAELRVGPQRILGAYAWQSLIRNGSRIALGSDFPVEKVSPLLGIYSAVTRLWLDGNSPHGAGGWYPNERLTMEQTLRGFTIDAAWASFQEKRVGTLEVGKEGDFVILNQDLTTSDVLKIPTTRVLATVVGGRLFAGQLR
ncbi:hypothetical protein T439DRAFT_317218 [Meredithblackwellia eburnea MCA 4105]